MSEPIVQVEEGKLRGKTRVDYKGGKFYSFQSIPYAKPPIGDLRFKAPVPPEKWEGIRDATVEPSESLSKHLVFLHPVGSEDCLYLNVFTPKLENDGEPLPVMVFIHGGGFVKGSSKEEFTGPEYLVSGNVILVTLNYRLGILGFLSIDDPSLGVPGNAALKDMVQALRWIQKNISNFNGDPKNVTIFGESAGGAAVHLLMLSPMAKGLFHRGIMQSGCAINPWVWGRKNVKEIAAVLGFNNDSEKDCLEFLKTLPVQRFLEAQEKIKDAMTPDSMRPFGPVIEKLNDTAFLTEHPIDIMASGNYNKIPIMLGFTSREGMLMEIGIKREHGYMKMFTNFEQKVPYYYNLKQGSELSLKVAKMIKDAYYGDENPTTDNLDKFYLLETDILFLRGLYVTINNLIATMDSPLYLYRLSVETELNFYKKVGDIKLPGVCHADDIGYLFKTIISPELDPSTLAGKSVHRIITLWTTFARYGNPNPPSKDSLVDINWEPVKPNEYRFLDIGEKLETGINKEDMNRMAVWNDIAKLMVPNSKL